ncbi:ferritin-1, chloroplastic-like [Helianthus annuus]|uniref:ferritin-1, chloroplastic-like n=1 Tax=Helianthus annuus TaxID=4232 RepID=UPI001652EF99|nr:ferritin-1, chloroplastic-like [Helianthus annuus]
MFEASLATHTSQTRQLIQTRDIGGEGKFGVNALPYIRLLPPDAVDLKFGSIAIDAGDFSGLAESMAQFIRFDYNLHLRFRGRSESKKKYANEFEAAINEQINVEYNVSYVYHVMYAYFDRDNVALKGLAKFFNAMYTCVF